MAVYNVSTGAELTQALARAAGGDTIRLAAGNYGDVSIRDLRPTDQITLVSASATNPAHFDTLQVRTSQNLAFQGLDIGRPLLAGEADHTQMAMVRGSSRIVFDAVSFHGSLDGNAQNDGYGLFADSVTALTVINSRFEQLTKGMVVSGINNLQISNNRFDDMRSDGLNVAGSKNVVVENNRFQGFYPLSYDHPDAMQFYNLGYTDPMSDVTIRNNVLLPGGTYGPQGVWISDPGTSGFRNFTIENNLLWSEGSYNGIGMNGMVGATITGNTVLSPATDAKVFWIRMKESSDILVSHNVSEDVLVEAGTSNLRFEDNVNLRTTPALRGQLGNNDHPAGALDLILSGVGYQLPSVASSGAPISGAIASALNGVLSANTGAALGQVLAGTDGASDMIDLSSLSDIAATAPAVSLDPLPAAVHAPVEPWHAPEPVAAMTMHQYLTQDWFTALP